MCDRRAVGPPAASVPEESLMNTLTTTLIIVGAVVVLGLALALRIVKQYERGVLFRLGRVIGCR
jgi:hypothetical protein